MGLASPMVGFPLIVEIFLIIPYWSGSFCHFSYFKLIKIRFFPIFPIFRIFGERIRALHSTVAPTQLSQIRKNRENRKKHCFYKLKIGKNDRSFQTN